MAQDRSRAGAPLPAPPRPTESWTPETAQELYRWLQSLNDAVQGVAYGRLNGLFLPGFPTSGYGLKPGEVFANDGILTMVREGDVWVGSFAVTASLGSVTVTT